MLYVADDSAVGETDPSKANSRPARLSAPATCEGKVMACAGCRGRTGRGNAAAVHRSEQRATYVACSFRDAQHRFEPDDGRGALGQRKSTQSRPTSRACAEPRRVRLLFKPIVNVAVSRIARPLIAARNPAARGAGIALEIAEGQQYKLLKPATCRARRKARPSSKCLSLYLSHCFSDGAQGKSINAARADPGLRGVPWDPATAPNEMLKTHTAVYTPPSCWASCSS